MSPRETICSFCGVSTHGYKDCPIMHQHIREQADALAQRRLGEYQQVQEWAEYEPPRQVPTYQGPLYRGGETHKGGPLPDQKPSRQRTYSQENSVKTGMYPHAAGGMAPLGEEELHLQAREVLRMTSQMISQMKRRMMKVIQMRKLYQ